VREVITHGETGRLVDFFDRTALVDEICALLEDGAERARLGQNARDLIRAQYDLRSICLPRQLRWVEDLASIG
jgi:glycosyltransferase involved in cell wall biosynthesis